MNEQFFHVSLSELQGRSRADNWQSVEQDELLIAINICYSCTTMSQASWNLITRNVQSCSLDFGYCCRRSVCTERLPSVCTGRESSMLEVAGGVTVCWSPGKQAVMLCCTPSLQHCRDVMSYYPIITQPEKCWRDERWGQLASSDWWHWQATPHSQHQTYL